MDKNSLTKLSRDLYNNQALVYNDIPAQEAFTKIIRESMGLVEGERLNYYKWQENKTKMFQILSVALDAVLPKVVTNEFDGLADTRVVAIGDKPKFTIKDNNLFKVSMVASGTQNLVRQTQHGTSFTVDTDWYGLATFAEFEQLANGEINWTEFVDKVAKSFVTYMGERIWEGVVKSYDVLKAGRKLDGSYDEDKLLELAQKISADAGGKPVAVYGTLRALRKITKNVDKSDGDKAKFNEVGYLGKVAGLDLIALPSVYKAGTEQFLIDDNTLLILPQGEKVISIVVEGDTLMLESESMDRNDLQIEFKTMKKFGMAVAQLAHYGIYKLTA